MFTWCAQVTHSPRDVQAAWTLPQLTGLSGRTATQTQETGDRCSCKHHVLGGATPSWLMSHMAELRRESQMWLKVHASQMSG